MEFQQFLPTAQPSTFQHPRLERHRYQERGLGKSHTAFSLRHVDISLRTVFLPVTLFTTQSTLGSRHEALFQRISFTFHGTLATTLAFAFLAFATFSTLASCALALVGGALAVFSLHQCFTQPTLLNGHRGQGLQSRARNHVLASLDSTCHEPPCTPDRLRTSSYQHCTLLPRMNQEHRSPTHPGGSSQTLQPGRFPEQLPLPSHRTLRLGIVARTRPSRCTRSHLGWKSFFFPGLLRVAALVASPGPGMIRRLMTVRRCRMPHQRS